MHKAILYIEKHSISYRIKYIESVLQFEKEREG